MPVGSRTSTRKTVMEPRRDADGKIWRQVLAGDTLVAKTPVKVTYDEFGGITAALADDTHSYYVGVPNDAAASGDLVWIQTGGQCDDVITPSLSVSVGHAFEIHNGAIADEGADYDGGANEFAICTTASSSSTTQDMLLMDRLITATT